MIFYNSPNPAPNPRRVLIFAAEKGIALDIREVSIVKREQTSPDYMAINPRGQTPSLQLDDGTVITESVAICRYLEALLAEAEGQRIAGGTADAVEGGMAFMQKRKPEFKGA